jgi:hypothetical protein
MADTKTTALTELASAAATDILYIVDDPGGTPLSKKITVANLHAAGDARTATLTNKTIDGDNNTITNLVIGAEVTGASTSLTDTADITYNADTDVSGNDWVVDEDDMSSDLATKVPTQQSVKAYADTNFEPLGEVTAINTQTDDYTLALSDKGKIVEMNKATANTLTIPTNASVAFPTGSRVDIVQYGAGTTTIAGDTGVTVNGASAGSGDMSEQYGAVTLYKRGTDEWIVIGAIGAVS